MCPNSIRREAAFPNIVALDSFQSHYFFAFHLPYEVVDLKYQLICVKYWKIGYVEFRVKENIATNMILDVMRSDEDQKIVEYSATFPTMASINRYVVMNLTSAHLLYAQEKYLARVKQYESSCKGKIKSSRLYKRGK